MAEEDTLDGQEGEDEATVGAPLPDPESNDAGGDMIPPRPEGDAEEEAAPEAAGGEEETP